MKSVTETELDSIWSSAVEKFAAQDFAGAKQVFQDWITAASSVGIQSAEAHHNLAVCHYNLRENGAAALNYLKSAELSNSPLTIAEERHSLAEIQQQIGLKAHLAQDRFFQWRLLLNENWAAVGMALGAWTTIIPLIWLLKKKTARLTALITLTLGFVVLGTSTALWLLPRELGSFGVVTEIPPESEGAPVYATSEPSQNPAGNEVLIHLPVGTLVALKDVGKPLLRTEEPVAGWIAREWVRD